MCDGVPKRRRCQTGLHHREKSDRSKVRQSKTWAHYSKVSLRRWGGPWGSNGGHVSGEGKIWRIDHAGVRAEEQKRVKKFTGGQKDRQVFWEHPLVEAEVRKGREMAQRKAGSGRDQRKADLAKVASETGGVSSAIRGRNLDWPLSTRGGPQK